MKLKKIIRSAVKLMKAKEMVPIPTPINTTDLLKEKVILITGGSGGIGSAMAETFIRNGAKVIIAGRDKNKLEKVKDKLENEKLQSIIINVKDVDSLPYKIKEAADIFGKIDVLVNAAGLVAHHKFLEMTEEEYDSIMNVNAKGTYFMSQAVAKYMIENHIKGHILNVTSSSALRPAWTPYQMSKWAVRGFTLGAADYLLPYGIIVNAIAPGPVATSMLGVHEGDSIYMENQPSGRFAMPSEIADLAVMLISDMGNLVVGDTLYATGGSGNLSYKF